MITNVSIYLFLMFAGLGATVIITKSWLFEKIRNFAEKFEFTGVLFNCPMCMGFWCGFGIGILFLSSVKEIFLLGLLTSLLGYLLELLEEIINRL